MRGIREGEYVTLPRIAARMGLTAPQLLRLYRDADFLMFRVPNFRRWASGGRIGGPWVWYTNEGLIKQWELMQIQKQQRQDREWRRIKGKGSGPGS